jgi:hypothetical protein
MIFVHRLGFTYSIIGNEGLRKSRSSEDLRSARNKETLQGEKTERTQKFTKTKTSKVRFLYFSLCFKKFNDLDEIEGSEEIEIRGGSHCA